MEKTPVLHLEPPLYCSGSVTEAASGTDLEPQPTLKSAPQRSLPPIKDH